MIPRYTVAFLVSLGGLCSSGQAQSLDSIRVDGYIQAAAVSPDARYIAIDVVSSSQQADGSWENAASVQVLEPATAKIVSSNTLNHGALIKTAPLDAANAFISYCDQGRYLLVYDGNGQIEVFNANSLALRSRIDLTSQFSTSSGVHVKAACSASSDILTISLQGGGAGNGIVKVVEVTSGKDIATWNEGVPSTYIKAISISQDGSKIALLLGDAQWPLRTLSGPNVEVRDTQHLGILSRFSTGDAASDLLFDGSSNIATVQGSAGGRFSGRRGILIWNADDGKELRRLADARADVAGSISSSADGRFILGYIPEVHSCALCNGLEGRVEVKKQQFAIWDVNTAKQVFRSDSFGPMIRPFQPQLTLSEKGSVVMAYWPSTKTIPRLIQGAANGQ